MQNEDYDTDTGLGLNKNQDSSEIGPDSWRDALDHQLKCKFMHEIPSYVSRAQETIRKLISSQTFQKQAK